jgi:predicted GNAT family acetyltransferase
MSTPEHAGNPAPADTDGVVDNAAQSRFELDVGDGVAVGYYEIDGDRITLLHTEVPQELSGRGIGSRLAKGVFETLRGRGLGVVAKCPFMASYAVRHPEYARMLVG